MEAYTHNTPPRPAYLRLSVTDRCNLRCRYCAPAGSASPQQAAALDAPRLVEIVRRIHLCRPLRKIRLTGGEPLMRRDLIDLVERIRGEIPGATLAATTNGAALARLAAPLKAAGISRLNISLDSLDPARFKALTGARLAPVLRGIEAAREAGFEKLKLNAVLQRTVNGDALPALVRHAASLGAEIRFIELMPVGCAAAMYEAEHLSASAALDRIRREINYIGPLPRSGTARRHLLVVAGRKIPVGFISAVSHPFCGTCDRLRLDSRGQLTPCLRSSRSFDLSGASPQEVARTLAGQDAGPRDDASAWPARQMVSIGG